MCSLLRENMVSMVPGVWLIHYDTLEIKNIVEITNIRSDIMIWQNINIKWVMF